MKLVKSAFKEEVYMKNISKILSSLIVIAILCITIGSCGGEKKESEEANKEYIANEEKTNATDYNEESTDNKSGSESAEDEIEEVEEVVDSAKGPIVINPSVVYLGGKGNAPDQFSLYEVNIETGRRNLIFSFKNERHYTTTFFLNTKAFSAYYRRQLFSNDITKMAVNFYNQKDGSYRVGWVDANGILTDVSEIIHPTSDSFSSMSANDTNALFSPAGEFFFCDMNAEKYCYLDPETMKIIKEEPMESNRRVLFMPNDSIRSDSFDQGSGAFYKTTIGDSEFTFKYFVLEPWDYIDEANQIIGIGYRSQGTYIAKYGEGITYDVDEENLGDLILTPETDFHIDACAYNNGKIAFSARRGSDNELFLMEDNKSSEPKKLLSLDKKEELFMWPKYSH